MNVLREDDENCHFFDAMEQIEEDSLQNLQSSVNCEYDLWTGPLQSVKERRISFIRRMGLISNLSDEASVDRGFNTEVCDTDRVMENSGAVLRALGSEDRFSSNSLPVKINEFIDQESIDPHFDFINIHGEGFEKVLAKREVEHCSVIHRRVDQLKGKWHSVTRMIVSKLKEHNVRFNNCNQVQRVKSRHFRKKLKELSGLFTVQNIQAHEGAILSMKFSYDGQYLASAGEDKIVRVWQVVEEERSDIIGSLDTDPSCVYFSMNHLSKLEPLLLEKCDSQKTSSRSLRKKQESACIIFPRKVFRIVEKAMHEFHGHNAAILDLSWSKNSCLLLSSSVDKTVRLWKVGVDECIKVFSHTDYVTCISFNPVNDNQFISGSIDGKVRTWSINSCQVLFWTETKDIITAASYSPDSKGVVIGSISGTCSIFNISDDQFVLESQVSLSNKRKSPCKRITAVQFLPQHPYKVLVTCADSQIRIIQGANVISKYKGLRNADSHVCATMTPNGKHIISASKDSHIYLWSYISEEDASLYQSKTIRSFEFLQCNASIAIPWPGLSSQSHNMNCSLHSSCLSFVGDSNSKGSATWPEEKLPISPLGKSEYKLFKSCCQNSSSTHACGLVLVTASCDGRIRTFHNYGLPVPL